MSLYCQQRKWRRRIDPSSVWNCCRTQKPASLCHKSVEGFIINAHFPPLSNTVNLPDHIPVKHFVSEGKTENQSRNNKPTQSQKVSQILCLLFLSALFLPNTPFVGWFTLLFISSLMRKNHFRCKQTRR